MSLMMADLFKNAFKGNRKHKNNTCIPQGIPNVGNTCYINSVIQVLKWTPGFQSRLDTCQKESQLALDVEKIMNVTDKRKLRSILKSLGTSIGRSTLTSGNQEDCFELYNALTENLHSSDDKCPAKLFEGSFLMTFSYESCGHIERQLQTFTSLSLPIMDTREAEKGNDDYGMKKMDFAEEKQEVIEKGEEEKIKERKGKIEDEGKVHELVKGVVGKEGGEKVKNLTVFKEENAENEKMVIKKGKVDQEKGNVGKEKTELVKVTKVKVDNGEDVNKDVERDEKNADKLKKEKVEKVEEDIRKNMKGVAEKEKDEEKRKEIKEEKEVTDARKVKQSFVDKEENKDTREENRLEEGLKMNEYEEVKKEVKKEKRSGDGSEESDNVKIMEVVKEEENETDEEKDVVRGNNDEEVNEVEKEASKETKTKTVSKEKINEMRGRENDTKEDNKRKEENKDEHLNTFLKLLTMPMVQKAATSENGIENGLERLIANEWYKEQTLQCRMCNQMTDLGLKDNINGETTKRIIIADPPPILVLQLNRVRQVTTRNNMVKLEKISDLVSYPETLDISPYSSKFCTGKINVHYQLYAVIVHIGTLGKGHYISYIKVPVDGSLPSDRLCSSTHRPDVERLLDQCEKDRDLQTSYIKISQEQNIFLPNEPASSSTSDKWFKFNDKKVTECKHPPYGDNSLRDAYMLFYCEVSL